MCLVGVMLVVDAAQLLFAFCAGGSELQRRRNIRFATRERFRVTTAIHPLLLRVCRASIMMIAVGIMESVRLLSAFSTEGSLSLLQTRTRRLGPRA